MSDTEKNVKWEQGFHSGTIRRTIRDVYGIDFCPLMDRYQDEKDKWWDVYYIPVPFNELEPVHQKKVIKEEDDPPSVFVAVRNYAVGRKHGKTKHGKRVYVPHPREKVSEEERKIRMAMYYQEHKEKYRDKARSYYHKHKQDPVWMEKQRTIRRENYREKNNAFPPTEEVVRRNQIKRLYKEGFSLEEQRAERIGKLMEKDEMGDLTPAEMEELKGYMDEDAYNS